MEIVEKVESFKLIGVGIDGIKNLESIEDKVKHNMDLEKIALNQDVDKEYVRKILDGVDILVLDYNSEDKKALQIVNAIGFMAEERRVLCIGLDSAKKENKDTVNANRIFKIDEDNIDDVLNLLNMMIDSLSDACTINIDVTDLKEVLASDKGIKYSVGEFNKNVTNKEIIEALNERAIQTSDELTNSKEVILIEMDSNYCDNEEDKLIYMNNLLMDIQGDRDELYQGIFSLYLKESSGENIKVALLYN